MRTLVPASSLSLAIALGVGLWGAAPCAFANTSSAAAAPLLERSAGAPPTREQLSNYGHWLKSRRGWVFVPDVAPGWQPFTVGAWAPASGGVGWEWVSDEPFGDTFHYGRWIDLDGQWVWLPGTVWSPAWVSWWTGPDYVGWAPFGYRSSLVFVDDDDFFGRARVIGHVRHVDVGRGAVRHLRAPDDDDRFREHRDAHVRTRDSSSSASVPQPPPPSKPRHHRPKTERHVMHTP